MTEIRKVTQLAWRRFLMTPEGQEGMILARERTPGIAMGESSNIIFQAGVTQGYKQALDYFSEFLAQAPAEQINVENP